MKIIDTHAHLYLEDFQEDIEAVIARAKAENVQRVYFPAIDSSTHDRMMQLAASNTDFFQPMMGVHPCSVKENIEQELAIAEAWLSKGSFAAVGEIGLDYYWDTSFAAQQLDAFNRQMQWALDRHLPVVIHTRNAIQDTIDAVRPFAAKGLTGIFHCFSGTAAEAKQVAGMNFMLGIGGVVTYKKAGLAEALIDVPLDSLVLETDAPYLTPVPFRGKRNESSYIIHTARKLAEVKSITVEELAAVTSANAEKIFRTVVEG
jgi:TatD DNase family protein